MQMKTKFPGWYVSRATHIHITAYQNATVLLNNTISGGDVNHIGQIFFNQTLLDEVALLEPYVSNQQGKQVTLMTPFIKKKIPMVMML